MAWTAAQLQADVLQRLGLTSTDPLTAQVAGWFALYSTLPLDQATALATLKALDHLKGRLLARPVVTDADINAVRAARETLNSIRADVNADLARIYASRGPLSGTMTATAPQSPPDGFPNANAARYRGTPYPPATEDW